MIKKCPCCQKMSNCCIHGEQYNSIDNLIYGEYWEANICSNCGINDKLNKLHPKAL